MEQKLRKEIERLQTELNKTRQTQSELINKHESAEQRWQFDKKDLETQVSTAEHERNEAREEAKRANQEVEKVRAKLKTQGSQSSDNEAKITE